MTHPLAVELFAGTMSGTAGWCALGGRAVGFDLEYLPHHGEPEPGASRVIQDVLTLRGEQFRHADFIWGSSPCQKYSYLAMPWSRSKCPICQNTGYVRGWGAREKCDCKEQSAKAKELRRQFELDGPDNVLFDSVSRIAREASAADGRVIPYVQENVRGAVPWVGKRDMSLAQWKSLTQAERIAAGRPDAVFGSFYLWSQGAHVGMHGKRVYAGRELADIRAGRGRFGMGVAPEKAVKVPSFRFDGSGRSFQTASVEQSGVKGTKPVPNRGWTAGTAITLGLENYAGDGIKQLHSRGDNQTCGKHRMGLGDGVKVPGQIQGKGYAMCRTGAAGQKTAGHVNKRDGHGHTRHLTNQAESDAVRDGATKIGGDWFSDPNSTCRKHGSKSNARKAASALIAKIPPALSLYIAEQFYPENTKPPRGERENT